MKSIFAGIFIGLAGFAYLVEGGLSGAILFAFGLVCIVYLELHLYTGMAGNLKLILSPYLIKDEFKTLGKVLLGNIFGTFLVAVLFNQTRPELIGEIGGILNSRLSCPYWSGFLKATGCGFIMDTIVYLYRDKKKILPILFGIPIFIELGFYHCIADAFYITVGFLSGFSFDIKLLLMYLITVLGNFLGCNLCRLLKTNNG